tara:strand:- start:118 stop:720 length:603 start_codon:yes stop_codon:yes gene_type:complete
MKGELVEENLPSNPMDLFNSWFSNVDSKKIEIEPNAMSLSTVGPDKYPGTRIVLLKKITKDGFVFFSNYDSAKGISIINNNRVCLSFFWSSQEQQVIVKGNASKINDLESTEYFDSRPIGSKIGAIVSNQSQIIPSREYLEKKYESIISNKLEIKRPENWGGYLVVPVSFEFWQGRDNRLHDRILYQKVNNSWNFKRLSP